jgi:ABC-type oligopeptide transport system ATPase subunit
MNRGRIVEIGDGGSVLDAPHDEYTKALLAAHPHPRLAGALSATSTDLSRREGAA